MILVYALNITKKHRTKPSYTISPVDSIGSWMNSWKTLEKSSTQPIQGTPNLHAVVSSPRGTLAPTSRQGASAGTTRGRTFVLVNTKGWPSCVVFWVSVFFNEDGGKYMQKKNMHRSQFCTFIVIVCHGLLCTIFHILVIVPRLYSHVFSCTAAACHDRRARPVLVGPVRSRRRDVAPASGRGFGNVGADCLGITT